MVLSALAPSANDPVVKQTIAANTINKAVGRKLLNQLPFWQTFTARLKSFALLYAIYTTIWPCTAVVLLLSWLCKPKPAQHTSSSSSKAAKGQANGGLDNSTPIVSNNGAAVNGSTSGTHTDCATPRQQHEGTVVITGGKMTKSLHVCRQLHAAGWRVVLVETHKYWHVGSRLSNAVAAFHTVPAPEEKPGAYVQAMLDIIQLEGASMFIPVSSPIASIYDALVGEAAQKLQGVQCKSWTLSGATTALLDHKALFSDYAKSLGLLVPQHHLVTSPQQLMQLNSEKVLRGKRFILKSIAYDSVHRTDLVTLPCPQEQLAGYLGRTDVVITEHQPWILQEFISGKEYSCYSLAHEGRLVAHADTAAALSNLNYKYEGHPGIRQWVGTFVDKSKSSGQLCFDFIQSESDGQLYCIECNPRTSSVITEFYDNPGLAQAFISPVAVEQPVTPLPASRATYWWWNEVARLVTKPGYVLEFLSVVSQGVDAVFSSGDPWPFLGLHYVQVPCLLLGNIMRGNPWKKVDLCIGKVAELYGD